MLVMDRDKSSSAELITDIECPFIPLMAQGEGSPLKRSRDLILFDESRSPVRLIQDESFEGFGGNSSILDPCDLKTEIAQLKFQVQNLREECCELKKQNSQFQDENLQLIHEKEEMEKRLLHRDLAQEKVKQLQKELEEIRNSLSSTEDLCNILRKKRQRLEKEYAELDERHKGTKIEYQRLLSELEKVHGKVKQKEEEVQRVKDSYVEIVQKWVEKNTCLESTIKAQTEMIKELQAANSELRKEKHELELSLVDAQGNQLLQLCSPEEIERPSRSGSPAPCASPHYASPPSSYLGRSLHAEIVATIERRRSIHNESTLPIPFQQFSGELVDACTQSEFSEGSCDEGFWSGERRQSRQCQSYANEYLQLVSMIKAVMWKIEDVISLKRDGEKSELESGTENSFHEGKRIDLAGGSKDEDMLQRVNDELAEFRQQLKKSQEIIQAMQANGLSTTSLGSVTQSCPVLVSTTAKACLVSFGTQTDPPPSGSRRSSGSGQQDGPVRSLLDSIDDDSESDGNYLDKLSDDISYRLTVNLPTVLEESEQETETSPGGQRRMSSGEKGKRRGKLVRSGTAHDEDPMREREEDLGSENGFASAASTLPSPSSSAFRSLERPLTVTRNGDSDASSMISDLEWGSPISSPSSPRSHYFTPLEGSSSQETITNADGGDRTPVNDGNGHDLLDLRGYVQGRSRSECGGLRMRKARPGSPNSLPNEPSVGMIPESDIGRMISFAYDVPGRAANPLGKIFTGGEWRTLRMDLEKKDQDGYSKKFAQEEGNDIEGGPTVDSACPRYPNVPDLEEEAEENMEKFPGLVDEIFSSLDALKKSNTSPTDCDLESLSARFNHLAHTFKVEHSNLTQRKSINLSSHEHATKKIENIVRSLNDIVQGIEGIMNKTKVPEDLGHLTLLLKHIPEDLSLYANDLCKTSRRVGMMDVQVRLYKMIEVMVLYVHILRNLCAEKDKEIQSTRKLLESHNVSSFKSSAVAVNNNNNNEKVSWDEGLVDESKSKNFFSDAYEALRCELFWPWNWDDTWKGLKQTFSLVLIVLGLLIIGRSVFPIVSADSPPTIAQDLGSFFSKHGNLHHPKPPEI